MLRPLLEFYFRGEENFAGRKFRGRKISRNSIRSGYYFRGRKISRKIQILEYSENFLQAKNWRYTVGETGYGCHTFYITDVFRNIVIIADITLLLCLNIVSCAHINMQFVIFTSLEIIYFYCLKKSLRV